ncbi:IclR family transcriptional regulator [Tomitella biformata]|uniref:IclR family transcriptional regulator n=1 Tax=Tomitella biformata TaxID=630403 RepID=UPI00046647DC|nr:IclR family transcriptional regulator [Tomitella biformata]
MTTADTAPTAIMERISLVLDTFEGPGHLTLAQVTRRTGLPRSTTHRMLERLVAMRWLSREGSNYELGTRLIELGSLAVQQNRLHSAALPVLHELHRVTGHIVHLGILDGPDVVYLAKIGTPGAAVPESRVGGRITAARSPIGRILLADTVHHSADPHLSRIRDDGIAFVNAGVVCGIGAPVAHNGSAIAAVSICGPSATLRLDHNAAAPVRIAASTIVRRLRADDGHLAPVLQRRDQLRAMPTATPRPHLQYA